MMTATSRRLAPLLLLIALMGIQVGRSGTQGSAPEPPPAAGLDMSPHPGPSQRLHPLVPQNPLFLFSGLATARPHLEVARPRRREQGLGVARLPSLARRLSGMFPAAPPARLALAPPAWERPGSPQGGGTFTVTTTADSGPDSLRQAISDANAQPGPDMIVFNIPGAGVQSIAVLSALPAVTDTLILDGLAQPGSGCLAPATPLIELNGEATDENTNGLDIAAGNTIVRGLVINRFGRNGIQLSPGAEGSQITCNHIGTDAAGTLPAVGNGFLGIALEGVSDIQLGGATSGQGNLISGNAWGGIAIFNSLTPGNRVQGNTIGTNRAGDAALPNGGGGVVLQDANDNLIGGAAPGEGNLISGNTWEGILIMSRDQSPTGNRVQGNTIGTNRVGDAALPNGLSGVGILGASDTLIGGSTAAAGNVIAHNQGAGVALLPGGLEAARTHLAWNHIWANGGPGIDLGNDGVTANDAGDSDDGANALQNYPTLGQVTRGPSTTTVVGLLQSSPNVTYTLDFYANQAADPTGFGEGQWPLGSAVVTTTASGPVTFTITLPVTTAADSFLTATATDPTGNTSEFSQAIPCQTRPSDVDLNGVVNILDIQQVAGDFGNAAFPLTHDLDCSQAIDVQDVILAALAWP